MSAIRTEPATTVVRSFIDLRAFAARSAKAQPASGDGYRTARRLLPLLPGPTSVGAVDIDATGEVKELDADEFVIVLAGALTVEGPAGELTLAQGRSAVLPKGSHFQWRTDGPARLVIMRYATSRGSAAGPVPVDESATLEPSAPPAAELLVGPTPSCRGHVDYRSASGELTCGVWDSTPYHRRSMPYRHHELMHLLAGAVTLRDGAGRSATFVKGDILLVEQGAECGWHSEVHVKKVYAIFRPA